MTGVILPVVFLSVWSSAIFFYFLGSFDQLQPDVCWLPVPDRQDLWRVLRYWGQGDPMRKAQRHLQALASMEIKGIRVFLHKQILFSYKTAKANLSYFSSGCNGDFWKVRKIFFHIKRSRKKIFVHLEGDY